MIVELKSYDKFKHLKGKTMCVREKVIEKERGERKSKAKEEAKNDLVGCFKVLGGELGDKPYFGGEIFGIVDIALNPFYSFFYTFEQNGNFGKVTECPKLLVRAHRFLKKDSLSKALPD
ncbi:hypothetical protein ACSBR2_027933 [Camellia fascicularis]